MNFVYKIVFNDRIKNNTPPPYYYIGSKINASYVDGKIIDAHGHEYYGSYDIQRYGKRIWNERGQ